MVKWIELNKENIEKYTELDENYNCKYYGFALLHKNKSIFTSRRIKITDKNHQTLIL